MCAAHLRKPLILLGGAEEWLTRSIDSVLGNAGYQVARARTGQDALDMAPHERPDAILLDIGIEDPDGFAVCRALRAHPAVSAATPIVLLTLTTPTRTEQLDALRAGAWELRGQPLDAEELLLRLAVFTRGKLELERLGGEGLVDQVSGLYNATGVARRSEELAALTARQGMPLACVVFRSSNGDGDDLARAFKTHGRISDAIGRTAYDEFAVFAPATDGPAAARLVKRLTAMVGSVRAGVSSAVTSRAAPPVSPQELLAQARSALGEGGGAPKRG